MNREVTLDKLLRVGDSTVDPVDGSVSHGPVTVGSIWTNSGRF
jgi:hypothetical protein